MMLLEAWAMFIIVAMACTLLALGDDPPDGAADGVAGPRGYELGQVLAHALARGCSIAVGTVRSVAAPEPEPGVAVDRALMLRRLELDVGEWLHNSPPDRPRRLALVHITRPEQSKAGVGPWLAWEGAQVRPGAPLLVVRWGEGAEPPTWRGRPEDVALALSDGERIGQVRRLLAERGRIDAEPAAVDRLAAALRDRDDPALAGFLVTYLAEDEAARDPDRATGRLASLLVDAHLPGPGLERVAQEVASNFYRLAPPTRATVTGRLVTAACDGDEPRADASFGALLRLAEAGLLDLHSHLTPARRLELAERSRRYFARRPQAPGRAAFEARLDR